MKTRKTLCVCAVVWTAVFVSGVFAGGIRPERRGVWVNQVGYRPGDVKVCVIPKPPCETFTVQTIDESVEWKDVFTGRLERCGNKFTGDFSSVTREADYRIVCGTGEKAVTSDDFKILENVHDATARVLLGYYTAQRCGSEKGWAGKCHQDPVPLVVPGGAVVRRLDVRGGYHQSCDLRCWNDGIPCALYGLVRYAERETARRPGRTAELAEEIAWGCDYFLKIVSPSGMVYDAQFAPIGWGPRDYYDWATPLGSHNNIARLLARASRLLRGVDPARAAAYLATAERVYRWTLDAPVFDRPWREMVDNLPRGTQKADFYTQSYRGSATSLAAKVCVETDLFLATGAARYADAARATLRDLLALQTREGAAAGMFREAPGKTGAGMLSCSYLSCSSGPLALVEFLRVFPDAPEAAPCREALRLCVDLACRMLDTANFDCLPRLRGDGRTDAADKAARKIAPGFHIRTDTTAPSLGCHLALLLDAAAEMLGDPSLRPYAQRCFDWAFGLNGDESSYIVGVGYTKYLMPVFGQFYPSTPYLPGAVFHERAGEYDMPATGMILFALAER